MAPELATNWAVVALNLSDFPADAALTVKVIVKNWKYPVTEEVVVDPVKPAALTFTVLPTTFEVGVEYLLVETLLNDTTEGSKVKENAHAVIAYELEPTVFAYTDNTKLSPA